MCYLKFTKEKVKGISDRIAFLLGRVFPYTSSEIALKIIKQYFMQHKKMLDNADTSAPSTEQLCRVVMADVHRSHLLIELIANSAHVRNVFEFHEPFWYLASKLIEPKESPRLANIHLVITSGWMYTPFVLFRAGDIFKDFIFISLPASEVHNPLLFPIAGHELGHVIWNRIGRHNKKIIEIKEKIVNICKKNERKPEEKGQYNIVPNKNSAEILGRALQHAEEFFCDCLGLRLFGEGYLHAFQYFTLQIPKNGDMAASTHPPTSARMALLSKASRNYGLSYRPKTPFDRYTFSCNDSTLDDAYRNVADMIVELANDIVATISDPDPRGSDDGKNCVLRDFNELNPTSKAKTLADIINAGWHIYLGYERDFSMETDKLFDIIAKSFEVFAIKNRIGGYNA